MLDKILRSTDLNEKEARLYIAALTIGKSTISNIAKKAAINRVTAYGIAEKLIQKGYLTLVKKGKVTYFDAINPDLIHEKLSEKSKNFKSLLADLKRLHKKAEHPTVRYFEGVEGIKAIYFDSLKSSTEILNYANSAEIREFWPEYDHEYVKIRAKKKIFLRGFAPNDEFGQRVHLKDKENFRKIKLLDPKKANFFNETNIYDDKISMLSFHDKPMGIIIQNQELADTQRSIFELLWSMA